MSSAEFLELWKCHELVFCCFAGTEVANSLDAWVAGRPIMQAEL